VEYIIHSWTAAAAADGRTDGATGNAGVENAAP